VTPPTRGAAVDPRGAVRFSVWAPHARAVTVRVLSGPRRGDWALDAGRDGVFAAIVDGVEAGSDYVYRLDAEDGPRERPDPASRHQPGGVHGPSRVVDPTDFRWTDAGWSAPPVADLVLYELHVGTFTAAGTFDAVVGELPRLRALGVNAIEIMPIGEFPGGRNWGYDGVSLYAPQSTYGGPEGFRRLVDAAHAAGIAVVLDVVYNHVGPEGNYLGDFGPYFTDRYRTPWGAAINFDGPDSDEVRRWAVENAVYWVRDFHVDGLRLDAVHAIVDLGARHVLAEIADAVHAAGAALGRRVHVIAESDLNDARLVRPPERGGHGLDAQWSDDFHHAVHAALTGERQGYYADFGGVAPVAKCLADRFVYDGRHSSFRRRRHGAPATDVPRDRFVVCVQNHDQVGNRARGDRLATLVPPAGRRLAAAALLLAPYVPVLFMGEEYGERNPFPYFVSHDDPALVEAVREGRRREFAAFTWDGELPDPQAEATFRRARLEPAHGDPALLALYADCLRIRRAEPALRPGDAECRVVADDEAGWVAYVLTPRAGAELLAVLAFGGGCDVRVPVPDPAAWRLVLSTEARRYGGGGEEPRPDVDVDAVRVAMPASSAVLLRRDAR
jgi:maltooligosyltrehalose trehalohydrolase